MQNLVNDTPTPKKNYEFVDAIRCIAMIAIVMEHAIHLPESIYHPSNQVHYYIYATFFQLTKFGTINFFLLAGFLIGEKFTDYSPLQYLKRRVDNTVKPWIFWSLFYLLIHVIGDIIVVYRFNSSVFDRDFTENIKNQAKTIYLYSNYWFIPNFLCCITVLLIFRQYLYSYLFGFILLCFSLIYSVNIYYTWIEPEHTTAILGFVFFLWLGAQLNKNLEAIENWIVKTSIYVWIALTIIALFLSVKEGLILRQIHSIDPYNSLRISNILYSIVMFFLLLKIKNLKFVNFLKPRETTFGIYLIHYIIIDSLFSEIFRPLKLNVTSLPLFGLIAYQSLRFILAYGITFGLVRILNYTKIKWTIGQ